MFAPQRAELSVSLEPFPPAPIAARLILLFRFCPRSMNGPKAAALNVAADDLEMNLRRESVLFGLFVIILLLKVDTRRQFQTRGSRKRKKLSPICIHNDRKKIDMKFTVQMVFYYEQLFILK